MTGPGWTVLSLSLLAALAAMAVAWRATRYRGMHCAWRPLEDPAPETVGTFGRRMPSRVETEAAAGGAPDGGGTWSSPPPPGAVPVARQLGHAGAMHAASEPYLPPVPLAGQTWPVVPTEDAPPWDVPTGSFPVVADEPCAAGPYPDEPYAAVPYEELPVWDSSPQAAQRLLSALRGEHPYPEVIA